MFFVIFLTAAESCAVCAIYRLGEECYGGTNGTKGTDCQQLADKIDRVCAMLIMAAVIGSLLTFVRAKNRLKKADVNRDGVIDAEEVEQMHRTGVVTNTMFRKEAGGGSGEEKSSGGGKTSQAKKDD